MLELVTIDGKGSRLLAALEESEEFDHGKHPRPAGGAPRECEGHCRAESRTHPHKRSHHDAG